MTISEAVIRWLQAFTAEEYRKMEPIDTEIQSSQVDTYSLAKEPARTIKSYITGRKEMTDYFTIQARLSSASNTDRVENNGFGEALERWVSEQNRAGNFPQIPDVTVQEISVTTPFYLGVVNTNDSIYQMTIAVKYEKER